MVSFVEVSIFIIMLVIMFYLPGYDFSSFDPPKHVHLSSLLCSSFKFSSHSMCPSCDHLRHVLSIFHTHDVEVYVCKQGLHGTLCSSNGCQMKKVYFAHECLFSNLCQLQATGQLLHGTFMLHFH